jgi:hypothetical protein
MDISWPPMYRYLKIALWLSFVLELMGLPSLSLAFTPSNSVDSFSRRCFVAGGASISAWIAQPVIAIAVPPITKADTDSLFAQTTRRLRPKPPKLLRDRLSLDFAVLLMRNSYNACDQLDVIAMNQFQRDFFLIRSAEYEMYVFDLGSAVNQGDLTDPNYFDFISYAQYRTINRAVADPVPAIFEEEQPTKAALESDGDVQRFETVLVRRNIADDELAPTFDRTVGRNILEWMMERYGDSVALPRKLSRQTMTASFEQLVKLFLINGYAWSGYVSEESSPGPSQRTYCFSLESPANAWSAKALVFERSKIDNNFLGKVVLEWLRASDIPVLSYKVRLEGNMEKTYITVYA